MPVVLSESHRSGLTGVQHSKNKVRTRKGEELVCERHRETDHWKVTTAARPGDEDGFAEEKGPTDGVDLARTTTDYTTPTGTTITAATFIPTPNR